jgi:hypothetical protein
MRRLPMLLVLAAISACIYLPTQKSVQRGGDSNSQSEIGAPARDGSAAVAGRDGRDGAPGRDGKDGLSGRDGSAGKDGLLGPAGRDGRDGTPGRDGKDGSPGKDGLPGLPGRDGRDGLAARLGILRDSSAPSAPFAFFFGHFPEANDGAKNNGHNVVTDFLSPIATGFAALVTAFSPLLLFMLERHKKAGDKSWPRRTVEVLVVLIAALCLGYLLYLFAYLILLFICAFMVCSSVMIAAVAYAYGTFMDMDLRERAFNRDRPPDQMSG